MAGYATKASCFKRMAGQNYTKEWRSGVGAAHMLLILSTDVFQLVPCPPLQVIIMNRRGGVGLIGAFQKEAILF
jgi:hypothetical protein